MTTHHPRLRILIVTPVTVDSQSGNGVTARRWAHLLDQLGHLTRIASGVTDDDFDLLVALHARKSAAAIAQWRAHFASRPIILALTGTDLYGSIDLDETCLASMTQADRLVVLQPNALEHIPGPLRERGHVIRQSVSLPDMAGQNVPTNSQRNSQPDSARNSAAYFDIVLLAHLRDVKDPLLAAAATRRLPAESRIRVRHFGSPLDDSLAEQARRESRENPRYEWLGERSRDEVLTELAGSPLMVLTSKLEGGANVVSEAIALGVPIIASRIDGSVGMLGPDYEGYFPVADAESLARQFRRAEIDNPFRKRLQNHVASLQDIYRPKHELDAWQTLLQSTWESYQLSSRP